MASIITKGNTIYAIYRVNGKQYKKSTFIKTDTENAELYAKMIADDIELHAKGGKPNITFASVILGADKAEALFQSDSVRRKASIESYFSGWMRERRIARQSVDQAAIKSNNRDETAIRQLLLFLGKKAASPLKDLTGQDIMLFIKKQRERVSDGTIGIYLNVISKALNDAVTQDLLQVSPFRHVTFKKRITSKRKAFTKEQVELLLEYLPKPWKEFILVCLYTGGQRLGDLALLRKDQIKLNHKTKGGFLTMITQKTGNDVSKPIIKPLYEVLKPRMSDTEGEYLFPMFAEMYRRNGAAHLSTRFKELLQELGFDFPKTKLTGDRRNVSELSFHCLRATAVTMLRNAGVPADLCRIIVGHNSEMIERIYYRPDDNAMLDALSKLDFGKQSD